MKTQIIQAADNTGQMKLPLFAERASCGFPSPAENYVEEKLDLNEYLIKSPSSTYFIRAQGDSMYDSIQNEDLLIVDKSLTPRHGDIIIAALNGEFLVKQYITKQNAIWLYPFNENYKPIHISGEEDFSCFGVVIHAVHSFR